MTFCEFNMIRLYKKLLENLDDYDWYTKNFQYCVELCNFVHLKLRSLIPSSAEITFAPCYVNSTQFLIYFKHSGKNLAFKCATVLIDHNLNLRGTSDDIYILFALHRNQRIKKYPEFIRYTTFKSVDDLSNQIIRLANIHNIIYTGEPFRVRMDDVHKKQIELENELENELEDDFDDGYDSYS